jgi:NADPH-dependent F420 reductase
MDENTVAVIGGTGDQGYGLALRWARAGQRVLIGSRAAERGQEAAAKAREVLGSGARVEGMTNAEAAEQAPLVVLSVPFPAHISTLKALRPHLKPGQILVDLTVPLEATLGGSATRMLGVWAGSAAELAAQNVPAGVRVVGAFHNVGAAALQDLEHEVECDVIVCGDDEASRRALRPWVERIPGCRWVDGGKLENARIVEALTALLIGINRRYKSDHAGIRITGITT